MKRRQFVQLAAASAITSSLLQENFASGATPAGQLDRFGGWNGKRFAATGFFRTEHDGQRWWLVTPEGNAFLSFGINHFQSYVFRQPHNKAAWRKRLGVQNLNDKAKFNPAYRDWALDVCRDYGINTLAMGSDLHVLNRPAPALPYIQRIGFLEIYHSNRNVVDEDFRDVFAPEFATRCEQLAMSAVAPHKDDPFLLGYCMIDCPTFTDADCAEKKELTFWSSPPQPERIGFPRRLRNLGAQDPGKQAYVRTMREVYRGNIKELNATYDTGFDSFESLAAATDWRPDTDPSNKKEKRDNNEFLQLVVAKYYETARDAIRRHDPNHLFLGDRLNGNTDTVDTVLQTTGKYTDLVFFQMYNRYEKMKPSLDAWAKIVDKPFLLGDGAIQLTDDPAPPECGHFAHSKDRWIEWTDELFRESFARPDFVGWHYCGVVDRYQPPNRKQRSRQKSLMNGDLEPYPELRNVLKACTDEMYSIAVGK